MHAIARRLAFVLSFGIDRNSILRDGKCEASSKGVIRHHVGSCLGSLMTLLIEVADWYPNRHLDSLSHILVRLRINIALGFVLGAFVWNRLEAQRRAKLTQSQGVVRFVLFVVLMLGLAYFLWWMVGRKTWRILTQTSLTALRQSRILGLRCDFITERTVLLTATPLWESGPVRRARRERARRAKSRTKFRDSGPRPQRGRGPFFWSVTDERAETGRPL